MYKIARNWLLLRDHLILLRGIVWWNGRSVVGLLKLYQNENDYYRIYLFYEYIYNHTFLMWPSNGTLKYGHKRQVVTKYRFIKYEIHCEGKLKLISHNTSYCLIDVVTKLEFIIKKKYLWLLFFKLDNLCTLNVWNKKYRNNIRVLTRRKWIHSNRNMHWT